MNNKQAPSQNPQIVEQPVLMLQHGLWNQSSGALTPGPTLEFGLMVDAPSECQALAHDLFLIEPNLLVRVTLFADLDQDWLGGDHLVAIGTGRHPSLLSLSVVEAEAVHPVNDVTMAIIVPVYSYLPSGQTWISFAPLSDSHHGPLHARSSAARSGSRSRVGRFDVKSGMAESWSPAPKWFGDGAFVADFAL
ncbi:MAG: hypothetical protein KF884_03925 [Fimbriimonadaceae bacterium]|nr:hypothetical protein [Fimbriimonadaceae bacterium]QYK59237.1 MAG: hypothetical protein KF884_03925 [Fimbriimonadaceae bacterium]